ncbi:hypothetical protein ACTU45_25710 [Streptomyces sp. 24-1644]|uniref:hypothetical protein n=1 Tax=Streptomyces sp. 24-1644 TaxID=3457315 RepID=UPI003FA7B8A1
MARPGPRWTRDAPPDDCLARITAVGPKGVGAAQTKQAAQAKQAVQSGQDQLVLTTTTDATPRRLRSRAELLGPRKLIPRD